MTGERGHPHFKRALLRVIRCALVVGEAFYRGRRITASRLAAVAPAEKISAVHEKLGHLSKGHQHLEWLQEQKGRPAEARAGAKSNVETTAKSSFTDSTILVFGK